MTAHRTKPGSIARLFTGTTQCVNPECGALFDICLKKDDGLCQTCRDRLLRHKEHHPKNSTKQYNNDREQSQYGLPKCPICKNPVLECNCPAEVEQHFQEWNRKFATSVPRRANRRSSACRKSA